MEHFKEACRTCLNIIYHSDAHKRRNLDQVKVTSIEELTITKLQTVVLNEVKHLDDNSRICDACTILLDDCYNFKINCFKNEEKIRKTMNKSEIQNKLNLRDILHWINNSPVPLQNHEEIICRICLRSHEKQCKMKDANVFHLLEDNLPELDINLTLNPDICKACTENLHKLNLFKSMCSNTESLIRSYCSTYYINRENVDLLHLVELTKQNFKQEYEESKAIEIVPDCLDIKIKSDPDEELLVEKEEKMKKQEGEDENTFNLIIFKTIKIILKPMKRNGIRMFECPDCNIMVKDIDTHLTKHADSFMKLAYLCAKCDYQDYSKDKLMYHLKIIHNEEKLYKCSQCSFRAKQKGNVMTHELTHKKPEEIQMFKCDKCRFQSRQKGNLKTHLLIHQNIKKFKCSLCTFKARQKGNLKTHILKKHTSFEDEVLANAIMFSCTKCSFKAKQKKTIRKHMISHDES